MTAIKKRTIQKPKLGRRRRVVEEYDFTWEMSELQDQNEELTTGCCANWWPNCLLRSLGQNRVSKSDALLRSGGAGHGGSRPVKVIQH
jgi:hypothetical protein